MDSTWTYGLDHPNARLIDHQTNQLWHGNTQHGLGIQQPIRADELELRIFQHPDIHTHYDIVELYLQIDNFTLQSIYHLREKNQFCKDLRKHHGSFFDAPPRDLFKLIYDLRLFKDYSVSETLGRFKASRPEPPPRSRTVIRTAPPGSKYRCPSEKCRKTFKKAGHAKNHVENSHAEYLKIYPGWEPQQDLVSNSDSRSPASDRHQQADESDGEQSRHLRHSMESPELSRPRRNEISTTSSETSNLNCISPRSLVFSSSSGDGDTDSRRNSRVSPLLPMTPLGLDVTSTIPYYPQQLSPTLKRGRSPGLLGDAYMCSGEYNGYSGSRHSTRHDPVEIARRHSQKIRR